MKKEKRLDLNEEVSETFCGIFPSQISLKYAITAFLNLALFLLILNWIMLIIDMPLVSFYTR